MLLNWHNISKKASEHDQKIQQLDTADQSTAPLGRATEKQVDIESKATSSLFHIKMIAKLGGHKPLYNKTRIKHRTSTDNGNNSKKWINNNRTTALSQTVV